MRWRLGGMTNAKYENRRNTDGITTEMMEHICDNLCKHPDHLSGEALEDKCAECKMGRFVCDILNQYNKCAKLLEQMHELKEWDTAKKPIWKTP